MEDRFSCLADNYKQICDNVEKSAVKSGRAFEDIEIVGVTKTVDVDLINSSIDLGISHIGENRVQELKSKYDLLNKENLKISVIGHLQTNKAHQAVKLADMIQSVDSLRLAREISKYAVIENKRVECLVEINVGNEASKSGISFENAEDLVFEIAELDNIDVCGLMIIPPIDVNISKTIAYFAKIHNLFIDISSKKVHNSNVMMKYLSMGMSSDYGVAIEEGANMVRIGTALYGGRIYK